MTSYSAPKGTSDLFPPFSEAFDDVVSQAVEQFRLAGFGRIETPAFEHTELFVRGLEGDSDIVTKEMYTFEDKAGRSLTLRPDMTAPVVRAVIEDRLDRAGLPVKLYYVSSVFRHEKPQAGRYRQFWQAGVEVLGAESPEIDAEVISLACQVYAQVGLKVDLSINSIGHHGDDCRARYLPSLVAFLKSYESELCGDCKKKIDRNPLRTFDCKVPGDQLILKDAPLITDHLCVNCKEHHETTKDLLTVLGVGFVEDPRLVRGLDYYTRTTFEFIAQGLGSQNAVGAGGRYDGLAELLGGQSLPGIGFGLGIERIALALAASSEIKGAKGADVTRRLDVFIASISGPARREALMLAARLRAHGVAVDLEYGERGLKSQFKAADRLGADKVIVIGEAELAEGAYTVRKMGTGEQSRVQSASIISHLKGGS